MPNRVSQVHEASLAGRRLQAELGADLREARLARGLRQIDVARATAVSDARISRVERGGLDGLAVAELARHGAAVGLRLHARFYPNAGGLRDAAQVDLLRRLRARIGDQWTWQLEAPINLPRDLRAFDVLLTHSTSPVTVAVEAITRLRDAQAQLRTATHKQRDGQATRLVLLIKASHANRRALASAADVLATTFPLNAKATLAALAAGEDPGHNGVILL
jgi:transcriptional regulator with XRE-family HTH domain